MTVMKNSATDNEPAATEKLEDGETRDADAKPDPDAAIREILQESDDGFPVRTLDVDEEKEEPPVTPSSGVDQADEIIHCYSHPTAKSYSSHWRKRIFGLEDWALVNYDALPLWLRDNDYIITGNRPPLPAWRHVFQSLLYLHNQTGNIYSHLICGIAMTALMIYTYVAVLGGQAGVTTMEYVSWTAFFVCSHWVLYVSAVFHLTLCHSRKTAFIGGCCDYTGIVLMIYGSTFLAIFYAFDCVPVVFNIYIGVLSALAVACAVSMYVPVMNTPKMRPWRSLLFSLFGLFGGIPMVHFIIGAGWSRAMDFGAGILIFEGIVYLLGALLFATRFPERLSPGLFDYWGHSHQFHHLCSGLGGFIHWWAMSKAFDYKHNEGCLYT